jgi:hypothetical protein
LLSGGQAGEGEDEKQRCDGFFHVGRGGFDSLVIPQQGGKGKEVDHVGYVPGATKS